MQVLLSLQKVSLGLGFHSSLSSFHRLTGLVRGLDLYIRRLHPPDILGILLDGPVAGELTRRRNVYDHHLGPLLRVLPQKTKQKKKVKGLGLRIPVLVDR